MSQKNHKEVSPFIDAALKLDNDFQELERLAGNLERAEIDSDAGLERSRDFLGKFGECSQRIGTEIQALATSLEDSRSRAEKAAESAANRAALIQERLNKTNSLNERFKNLAEMVRMVSDGIAQFKKPGGQQMTEEERKFLSGKLPELDAQMSDLGVQAVKLKEEARQENMRLLERNADSLEQTLASARQKLGKFTAY
jgi:chromosome segregation ATPase